MILLGDITRLNGWLIPIVDCVIGGSPCQNLSIAGNRDGLEGSESRLFLDQIRLVKEMRNSVFNLFDRKPRFMLWENVPGALSSNKGRDFQRVLTECVRIAEPSAPDVPIPAKGWTKAGSLMGDGFSIAWRILDAQYWGVPQRRRRIALICDFGGFSAPEILFVRESLSEYPTGGGTPGKETSGSVGNCSYLSVARSPCGDRGPNIVVQGFGETGIGYWASGIQTLRIGGDRPSSPTNVVVISIRDKATRYQGNGDGETVCTLAGDYVVRRLTPLERERLQGYPDDWTDIGEWTDSKGKRRECSDSARCKALGNSIALPPWRWVLHRMKPYLPENATMGSLFDGISGFPLLWEELYGSCVWSSEIEEFCIAVSKAHFNTVEWN